MTNYPKNLKNNQNAMKPKNDQNILETLKITKNTPET